MTNQENHAKKCKILRINPEPDEVKCNSFNNPGCNLTSNSIYFFLYFNFSYCWLLNVYIWVNLQANGGVIVEG